MFVYRSLCWHWGCKLVEMVAVFKEFQIEPRGWTCRLWTVVAAAKLITRYRRERCVQGPWWSGGQDGNSGQWEWQMRGRTEVREGGGLGDGVSVVCAGRRPGQSLLDSSLAVMGKCSDFIN